MIGMSQTGQHDQKGSQLVRNSSDQPYLDILLSNVSTQQMADYKLKFKILKDMDSRYFVRPLRFIQKAHDLHLHYEYCTITVAGYIKSLNLHAHPDSEGLNCFLGEFETSLNRMIEVLIHYQIKSYLPVDSLMVCQQPQMSIRALIEPHSECLALDLPFSTEQHDVLKLRIQANRNSLQQFYQTQRKRLILEIEEIIESEHGKLEASHTHPSPNFIINGSKLLFKNENHKTSTIQPHLSEHPTLTKKELLHNNCKKIEEIKNSLNSLSHKNQHIGLGEQKASKEGEQAGNVEGKGYELDQMKMLMNLKKLKEERSVEKRKASPTVRNINQLLTSHPDHKQETKQQQKVEKEEKKERGNKYKMKITTQHEIEIQGANGQPTKETNGQPTKQTNGQPTKETSGQPFKEEKNILHELKAPIVHKQATNKEVEMKPDQRPITPNQQLTTNSNKASSTIQQTNTTQLPKQTSKQTDHKAEAEMPTDSFLDKIKEAKNRAEAALKNCGKQKTVNH